MAYVGTAQKLGNDQDTLRSIVLGEAGGQGYQGQLAVADVMQNRANAGGFGGSTMVDVATAKNQFQGQVDLSKYSPEQIATADRAIADAQSGKDITGGATYYANPGASSAKWATNLDESNSLKIGDHYFTDNTKGVAFQPDTSKGVGDTGTNGDQDAPRPLTIHRKDYDATGTGGSSGTGSDSKSGSGSGGNAAGIVANAENWGADLFIRFVVIILGLIMVAFSLWYFKNNAVPSVAGVKRLVKKHPLVAAI